MKKMMILITLFIVAIVLAGCAPVEQEPVSDQKAYEPPVLREKVIKNEPEPSPELRDNVEEIGKVEDIKEEKQIATGSMTIKEEEPSLLSAVNCTFVDDEGEDNPDSFSFSFVNTEKKEWIFAPLSYEERERFENPIITVNALQVTDGQLVEACGGSRFKESEGASCNFDLSDAKNIILRKSLRKGETAAGNPQVNTINLRTSNHAAEIKFFCE